METTFREQEIQITSVFFSQNQDKLRFVSYPKKLVYKGHEYILKEA
jgi:hypothetical protein